MPLIRNTRLVLAVRNLRESSRFYMDVLGFKRDFGDESDGWAFLSRDAFKIMIGECPDEVAASRIGNHSWVVYVTVDGVDELHDEIARRGAEVISRPTTQP